MEDLLAESRRALPRVWRCPFEPAPPQALSIVWGDTAGGCGATGAGVAQGPSLVRVASQLGWLLAAAAEFSWASGVEQLKWLEPLKE